MIGYSFTVCVYIVNLIYIKATYRYKMKMKYLEVRYPERFKNGVPITPIKPKLKRKEDTGLLQTLGIQIMFLIKNPYLHLLIFRFCCFGWIFLYFCFQSLVSLAILLHSIVYINEKSFMNALKFIYMPLLWLVFMFNYIVNIQSLFDDSLYISENWRFGIFYYEPAFIHLLFQLFTLFYGCFTIYLFRNYHDELAKEAEDKAKKEKRKEQKRDRMMSATSNFKSSSRSFAGSESVLMREEFGPRRSHTYEIILRYILKNIDITLMIVLYIAGVNRIDVYHMILLLLFAVFIMYPEGFRRNFILLLYFMFFIASIK